MKCCLISAPTTNDFTDEESVSKIKNYPPIGVLTLAGTLRAQLIEPLFFDLNDLYLGWLSAESRSIKKLTFARFAADRIAAIRAEVFGFSSICSSYPLTLRIAQAVKAANPDAYVILGGPQASSVAEATMRAFDGIDFIVRGEADYTFPLLLRALQAQEDVSAIPGLTFRTRAGVVNTPDSSVIEDLDSLPLPAFDLYANMDKLTSIPIEAGRGCPFDCSFCATSRFFGRRFRMKTPELLVSQILKLHELYKVKNFDLIHDNFVVNKARLQAFCNALLSSGTTISWGCSARTDGLDPATIDLMASAGCSGIFMGIESGSKRMQLVARKNLNLKHSLRCIRRANKRKIPSAVALIIGFPQEKISDLRKTVNLFVETLRFDQIAPQISLLSPLPGTPIHEEYQNNLSFTGLPSDLAFQGWNMDRFDRDLVAAHPEVFSSFYALPTLLDRNYLFELRRFLLWDSLHSRWLLVALKSLTRDALKGFDAWQDWVHRTGRERPQKKIADYYQNHLFHRDFLTFMRTEIAQKYRDSEHIINALVDYEATLLVIKETKADRLRGASQQPNHAEIPACAV